METTLCLVICVIIFDKPGGVLRKRIHNPACTLVTACAVVLCTLGGPGFALCITGLFAVGAAEIAFTRNAGHIVHGGSYGCLNTGIQCCSIDCHTSETADTDNADTLRIHQVTGTQEIHCGTEVLRIDVRGSHPAGLSAAFTGK